MSEFKVDYHFHSYYSDGIMKPTELVKKYKEDGYDEIALTDHDGIDGVPEALIAGEALGIQVISGIELSTNFFVSEFSQPIDMHILGYRFDVENEELLDKCKDLMQARKDRNKQILEVLREKGYIISDEDLIERKNQKYIGKPNIARALLKKGYIKNYSDAFEKGKFLESEEIKAIKKRKMSGEEAIALIRRAGGIPVLAHPMEWLEQKIFEGMEKNDFFDKFFELVKTLKKQGLKGIECYHPSATDEDSMRIFNIAQKLHLHITRGSDFHGDLTKL